MFRNHGSGSRLQLWLNSTWNYPQIPISQSVTISAELFYASGRLVHNFGLEYFHLNPSSAVMAHMLRNHGLRSYLQLQFKTVWIYPQILISQSATILARESPISLLSSQSITITVDSNLINSLSLTVNRGLRSSMAFSTGYKNLRVLSHVSDRQFASSTYCIVHLSHFLLIALSAHLFFFLPPSLYVQ